jgi:glutaredoxin
MDFPEPKKGQFTVYSKSGCTNCVNVKTILKEKNLVFNVVDCDEFILETKKNFYHLYKH